MQIQKGDFISVHYTGRFTDGTVFDTSHNRNEPLDFTVGAGQMIKGFDEAVVGMKIDEEKTVVLQPNEAYGETKAEYLISVERTQLPPDLNPEVGDQLMANFGGQDVPVVVAQTNALSITLDANHPMAGKVLEFDIKIVSIDRAE